MAAESITEIVRALEARRSGSSWLAKCPAHDDRNPSLSIREADGKVLLHCHAGCSQLAVIEALNARGLWQPDQTDQRRIVATYNYTDEAGELLYQIVRFEPKDFRPRYPDGRGGWIWRKHPHQVLYHLPEVIEAPIIFYVEGEKDVECLRSWGFVATTAAGGCKARWLPAFTETLRGREVILIPDNDEPGWNRVLTIARALLGSAARIRVLDLPTQFKDISDFCSAGHSECELISMLEGCHAV